MTQTETLPEIKDDMKDSQEFQGFDDLSYARQRLVADSVEQVFSPDRDALVNLSIQANYKSILKDRMVDSLPDDIRLAEDDAPLDLFERDPNTNETLVNRYVESVAKTLADEANGRMLLYDSYLFQLTEEADWHTIYNSRKKLENESLVHKPEDLQDCLIAILAMNGTNECSAEELKTLAVDFTSEKFRGQDFYEACWLGDLKGKLGLREAVHTIKDFEAINREQEALATRSWLGRKVMEIVGRTRRRLGRSALADFH